MSAHLLPAAVGAVRAVAERGAAIAGAAARDALQQRSCHRVGAAARVPLPALAARKWARRRLEAVLRNAMDPQKKNLSIPQCMMSGKGGAPSASFWIYTDEKSCQHPARKAAKACVADSHALTSRLLGDQWRRSLRGEGCRGEGMRGEGIMSREGALLSALAAPLPLLPGTISDLHARAQRPDISGWRPLWHMIVNHGITWCVTLVPACAICSAHAEMGHSAAPAAVEVAVMPPGGLPHGCRRREGCSAAAAALARSLLRGRNAILQHRALPRALLEVAVRLQQ